MKDNKSIFSCNTNYSIRTNYNNYKNKIKRANSKPSISRTKEFFNNEITYNNQNLNEINYYCPNKGKKDTNNIQKNIIYCPTEASNYYSQKNDNANYSKRNLYPNTKRVIDINYQDAPKIQKHINNDNTPKDDWAEMLYHPLYNTENYKRISNSKTFQSNVFPNESEPIENIRHNRKTKYSDRLHKTQITTLPGCVKRGKYDIKDDQNFNVRNTESYLYKMEHDFTSKVNFGPLTKEEKEINQFPKEQRYQGSYQRGVRDNDIFNLKMNKENKNDNNSEYNEEEKVNYKGKKMFRNNNTFKSQIEFV